MALAGTGEEKGPPTNAKTRAPTWANFAPRRRERAKGRQEPEVVPAVWRPFALLAPLPNRRPPPRRRQRRAPGHRRSPLSPSRPPPPQRPRLTGYRGGPHVAQAGEAKRAGAGAPPPPPPAIGACAQDVSQTRATSSSNRSLATTRRPRRFLSPTGRRSGAESPTSPSPPRAGLPPNLRFAVSQTRPTSSSSLATRRPRRFRLSVSPAEAAPSRQPHHRRLRPNLRFAGRAKGPGRAGPW